MNLFSLLSLFSVLAFNHSAIANDACETGNHGLREIQKAVDHYVASKPLPDSLCTPKAGTHCPIIPSEAYALLKSKIESEILKKEYDSVFLYDDTGACKEAKVASFDNDRDLYSSCPIKMKIKNTVTGKIEHARCDLDYIMSKGILELGFCSFSEDPASEKGSKIFKGEYLSSLSVSAPYRNPKKF